jgi:hypothetical protein
LNFTRQTCESASLGFSKPVVAIDLIVFSKNRIQRCPQSRQRLGSHACGFPRTSRGSSMVLKVWNVVRRPPGVRKPTTIS